MVIIKNLVFRARTRETVDSPASPQENPQLSPPPQTRDLVQAWRSPNGVSHLMVRTKGSAWAQRLGVSLGPTGLLGAERILGERRGPPPGAGGGRQRAPGSPFPDAETSPGHGGAAEAAEAKGILSSVGHGGRGVSWNKMLSSHWVRTPEITHLQRRYPKSPPQSLRLRSADCDWLTPLSR